MNKGIILGIFAVLFISTLFYGASSAMGMPVNTHVPLLATNATQALSDMLGRLTYTVNVIAGSIIGVVWIYEAIFLILHKDDKEGLLKFKRDLPVMVLATIIIFGAATIVNVLSWIGHG
jgi:type IV secretory pathway VirB2 component (pilin)